MNILARFFVPPKFISTNQKDTVSHACAGALSFLFLLVHTAFGLYYLRHAVPPMVWVNAGSILFYLVCLLLGRRGYWRLCSLLISAELSLYCILTVFFVGWGVGAQGYLPVMMFPTCLLFNLKLWQKAVRLSLFTAAMAVCYLEALYVTPAYSSSALWTMAVANLVLCMSSALLTVGMITIFDKITEQSYQDHIADLSGAAHQDLLTGLWNRRYATRVLEELSADPDRREHAFIALADIDFFKAVNDTYGHDVGDAILRQLSGVIRDNLRSTDLVARWGGEEFLVVLTGTTASGAGKALNTLRAKVEGTPFSVAGRRLSLTITCGFCALAGPGGYSDALRHSDLALYHGKNHGRNQVVDYHQIQSPAVL